MLDLSTYCDISDYQNHRPGSDTWLPINFRQMQDQAVRGVVIRKSLGRVHDPSFERNWQGAGDVGLERSIYIVPYVSFAFDGQYKAAEEWPSGGLFDGELDIPAWCDVERKHTLSLDTAVRLLLVFLYWMRAKWPTEIYTAKYVFQDFYSSKPGWQKEWGLVCANYLPVLYSRPIAEVREMVAAHQIHPDVPMGWLKNAAGFLITPSDLRWEQWQISADGNGLGSKYGCHSAAVDISFRQGALPPEPAPPPPSPIGALVRQLGEQHKQMGDTIANLLLEDSE